MGSSDIRACAPEEKLNLPDRTAGHGGVQQSLKAGSGVALLMAWSPAVPNGFKREHLA
jgi:hypothetical protein